ncbi:hypothetical protein DPEC_G00281640 [Dallia pectoralis]|uniref:Uncharacterized protein n=1 Tax=Dallia pectoralis TaxID=75939 RepID=A0ACC2FMU8_DALPE|nr:hypothetical protein DPEC_G00281640 [Dallia pectoralis]
MAEPRKVPFVTISSFNNNNASPSESKKPRREDEAEISLGEDGGGGCFATGPGSGTGRSIATGPGTGRSIATRPGCGTGISIATRPGCGTGISIATWPGCGTGISIVTGPGSGTGGSIATGPGSATGRTIATGPGSGTGRSIGTGPGSATSGSIATGPGSATGSSIATGQGSGTGRSIGTGPGSGTGSSIATGQGSGTGRSIGTGPGSATGSGTGRSIATGPGSGTGISIATGPGSGTGRSIATGPGSGTGRSIATGPGSGTGISIATGPGNGTGSGAGSSIATEPGSGAGGSIATGPGSGTGGSIATGPGSGTGGSIATGPGSGSTGGTGASPFGNVNMEAGDGASMETRRLTVRLNLSLSEPCERGSAEFNYSELVQSTNVVKPPPPAPGPPKGQLSALEPGTSPLTDYNERREMEALTKKFESKYGNIGKKKRKDRIRDLIDIGFGYDDTDPFIDNSEAYDELVPASLTTKLGGFYINTGTLQFRAASESEGEDFKKLKDGKDRAIKKRRKKQDGINMDDKKPRKNMMSKQGVSGLNVYRPEKKKRKKLMKDSLNLAAMLRCYTQDKERRKINPSLQRGSANVNSARLGSHPKPADINITDLASDPAMMSLLGAANNNDMLQEMMGDLDFGLLDSPQPSSPAQGENGALVRVQGKIPGPQGGLLPPPALPNGLPAPLSKRIEDLRTASRQFDQEGRKKFFTLDMNNILLDIELQVQEQPAAVRSSVYSHLEAFVPCNKEALLKRLKKLSLNIQDDRLRAPLLKLKLAVCSVMPEQIARYNMDCIAKVAKQQSEEGDKNGSEEEDEDKPGKRVMGPRKKFVWDEKLRTLLCNLVRVKLGCYELEGQSSISPEDYLKAFMETEVKLLWPKGWMQARILFKESSVAHGHLTGNVAKKKIVPIPKAKPKEGAWVQRSTPSGVVTPSSAAPVARRPLQSPAEPICLDSLDDDLPAPSLDTISQALAMLSNAAKGLVHGDSPPSPDGPKTSPAPSSLHASPVLQQQKKSCTPGSNSPVYVSTSSLSRPSAVSSPLSSARSEGLGSMKAGGALAQAHRQSVLSTQRPAVMGLGKAGTSCSLSQAKPRPPPTASPLAAPNQKGFGSSVTKADSGDSAHPLPHAPPRVAQPSQSKASPLSSPSFSHSLPVVAAQPQSNFITPMQATLTKSSHSSTSPIIKLTPRLPNPSTPTPTSSSSNPRPQTAPTMHQFSSKSPAGFRPPISGAQGGPAKHGGSYSPAGGQKTVSQMINSSTNTSLTNTSSISKHSGSSASPSAAMTSQRQRPAGGTTQGTKPLPSVSTSSVSNKLPQVSSASSNLLASAQTLPLGFGMLGGLVPVSLPFQFPSLLNLPPLMGTAGSNTVTSGSSTSSNNLLKRLQSGSQVALPPHMQRAFSDVSQSQGGDVKRKSL